jgi:starch-binding outer membrane protein, SusD/RagB family
LLAEASSADAQTKAEATFLRAYFSYLICDMFGQLQHRPATAAIDVIPDVYSRAEAIDFIIGELETVIPQLPAYTPALRSKATKEAAQFLLAKCYLNKSVYKQDPASPAGPYTFAASDMNKVIELTNAISANAQLKVADYYWDNFTWENGTKSTENIFTRFNGDGGNNTVWATCMGNHYSMTPDGWNGFTTLADFYNSFDDADVRKRDTVRGTIVWNGTADNPVPADDSSIYFDKATKSSSYIRLIGRPAGFLVGQQKGPSYKNKKYVGLPVNDLKDRAGNPLIFTPDVSLFFSTESKGIRTNKYPLDPKESNGGGWGTKNEFVFFRFSDIRLMKAEAILRGGTDAETPLAIVNGIRAKRNVANLGEVSLTSLLAERGRELYLEAWRRNDLIRFEKFNDPVGERPSKSDGTRCVFPIPLIALSSNPNLHQNTGY